jgi:16S rRNA processing protein RimM
MTLYFDSTIMPISGNILPYSQSPIKKMRTIAPHHERRFFLEKTETKMEKELLRIGKIVATHGLNGALTATHITGAKGWLKVNDVLFVAMHKHSRIPFFATTVKWLNETEMTLHFEGIGTVEAAKKLLGKAVYIPADKIAGKMEQSPLLWIGFAMHDRQKGLVGHIEDVLQAGAQWLAQITVKGKEVLIPLQPELILKVAPAEKYLLMNLPEGLIEIYTSE